jgi:protein TonB
MVDSLVSMQRATDSTPRPVAAKNPLDRVLELGARDRRRVLSVALAAALFAHAGMAGALHFREEAWMASRDDGAAELVIEREEPPPPPPPPVVEPPPPEPPPVVEKVIAPAPPPEEPVEEPPASEAAQAGEVLVQEEDADDEDEDAEEEDDNTIVTGTGDSYAGGVTMVGGTSTLAVHGTVVAAGGVPGGSGTAVVAPPKPLVKDLSRDAWLEGSTSWDCDFPGEADRDHVNHAAVEMTVMVSPKGKPQEIHILDDPGHGFARMASACALKHTFAPARDSEGQNIWGRTRPFHIGFHR